MLTANRLGSMTFATQSVVRYLIAIDLCARLRLFYFTPAFLARRLCSQSGSSRDPSPVSCVTPTVTMRSTTIVVRVSGSRKPLFKFANYLMTGQTRTRPLQFSTDHSWFPIASAFRFESDKREKCRSRASDVIALWLRKATEHFFAAAMRTSVKKKIFTIEQT